MDVGTSRPSALAVLRLITRLRLNFALRVPIELVLDSLAWHPRFDPGLQHFDEVLVRERRSRAPARGPGPEDERIRLHVLDDLLSRATAAVTRRVLDLFADLLLAPAFPQHGQGREVPVLDARHEPVGRVRRLMAGLARLRRGAMAVFSADNEGTLTVRASPCRGD